LEFTFVEHVLSRSSNIKEKLNVEMVNRDVEVVDVEVVDVKVVNVEMMMEYSSMYLVMVRLVVRMSRSTLDRIWQH
jgi:hypothetical protein